jgi:endonuclease/exonuclease/phosphatase family metal-dependent hydrolase
MQGLHALDGRSFGLFDAFAVAHPEQLGFTWDNRNPYVAKEMTPNRRIDYIFVGDPFVRAGNAGRVVGAEVVADEALTGVLASDHAGLVAEIVWPDRPAEPG